MTASPRGCPIAAACASTGRGIWARSPIRGRWPRRSAGFSAPTVGGVVIQDRVDRDDPVRVHRLVAVVIMAHDMVEIHRLAHAGPLVEFADIAPEVGVIDDAPAVALEMQVVDRIEADERGKE